MASQGGKPYLKEGDEETWLSRLVFLLYRFLVKGDGPIPFLREILGGMVVVGIILAALWGGTGQSFPGDAPVVVVESGSMMHCLNGVGSKSQLCEGDRYGRVGTIDPGDLVFVKAVDGRDDVRTHADGGKSRYGKPGDVIVYHKNGDDQQTPIIHRAMFWLQIHGDGTYSVPELNIHRRGDLNHPTLLGPEYSMSRDYHLVLERNNAGPEDSGFMTRGDNNPKGDQPGINQMPVHPDWILGKSRGEIPWLGLIKLRVSDWSAGTNFYDNAPKDLQTSLIIVVVVIVAVPFGIEMGVKAIRNRRYDGDEEDPGAAAPAPKKNGDAAPSGDDVAPARTLAAADGGDVDEEVLLSFNPVPAAELAKTATPATAAPPTPTPERKAAKQTGDARPAKRPARKRKRLAWLFDTPPQSKPGARKRDADAAGATKRSPAAGATKTPPPAKRSPADPGARRESVPDAPAKEAPSSPPVAPEESKNVADDHDDDDPDYSEWAPKS